MLVYSLFLEFSIATVTNIFDTSALLKHHVTKDALSTLLYIFWVAFGSPACVLPILYSSLCYKAQKIRSSMTAAGGRPKIDHKGTITFFLMFLSMSILNMPFNALFFLVHALTVSAEFIFQLLQIILSSWQTFYSFFEKRTLKWP